MFESAWAKLQRAYQHTLDLQQSFDTHAFAHPYRALVNFETKNGRHRAWVDVQAERPIPEEIGLMLGDALHNMRCVLDHLVWELIALDGGKQDQFASLKIHPTREGYEAALRGMVAARPDTKQFLMRVEPYPGGAGELLYALHRLDISDKHRVILPVAHATEVYAVTFINLQTGERERRGPLFTKKGAGMTTLLVEAPEGESIDENEYIEATPGIFFGEVDGAPFEAVSPKLAKFRMKLTDVLCD